MEFLARFSLSKAPVTSLTSVENVIMIYYKFSVSDLSYLKRNKASENNTPWCLFFFGQLYSYF